MMDRDKPHILDFPRINSNNTSTQDATDKEKTNLSQLAKFNQIKPTNQQMEFAHNNLINDNKSVVHLEDNHRHYAEKLIRPTAKRYLILFLFCLNAGNKAFQWIQLPASTNKVTLYYGVSNYVINTTSVLFMLTFVFLSLPSCYIIELIGLRKAVILGSFGTALGSVVKCFCCQQTSMGVYLLFAGQILVSLSEQFIFSVPSRLASVWFPDHQVSSAVAMTIFGQASGTALGFIIPQYMLESASTKDEIGQQLYYIFLGTAVLSVASFLADLLFFDEAPKFAPGAARLTQIHKELANKSQMIGFKREMTTLLSQVKRLFANRNYSLLFVAYGINVGLGYTIETVLNQMLEPLWPGDDILIGNTGSFVIMSGALGSALFGQLLDKSHRYRLTNILLTIATALSVLAFGFAVSGLGSRLAIYVTSAFVGLFQTGLVVAGLELAVELTYPAPELITSSILNVSPQVFGCIFIYITSYLIDNHGAIHTNLFLISTLILATALLWFIRESLNRQKAVAFESSQTHSSSTSSIIDQIGITETNNHHYKTMIDDVINLPQPPPPSSQAPVKVGDKRTILIQTSSTESFDSR